MNEFYDYARAREYLRQVQTGVIRASANQLPSVGQIQLQEISFQTVPNPPSDRIMRTACDEPEELILTIQGVLSSSTLPPLPENRRYSTAPAAIRNLRQFVQITGFGLPEFDEAVDKLHQIQEAYEAFNPIQTVKELQFTKFEGHKTFEAHARYFTDRYLIPMEKNIPFPPLVDPHGVLAKMKPDSFIHGADNDVEYCKLVSLSKDGNNKYAACDPRLFKAGDIVEVAFTCFAIPIKNDRRCLLVNLKAVTLLCDLFRKDADRKYKAQLNAAASAAPSRAGKRRCLYTTAGNETVERIIMRAPEFRVDARLRSPREGEPTGPIMDVDF